MISKKMLRNKKKKIKCFGVDLVTNYIRIIRRFGSNFNINIDHINP